jgi:hypothetical protein
MAIDALLCGVIGGALTEWPASAPRDDAHAFLDLAERSLALPLVAYRLGAARKLDRWPAVIAARARAAAREALLLEAIRGKEDGRVLSVLADAGVRPLLLKGAALARRLYPAPWLRPRVDTDLLVPERDVDRVAVALARSGYREDAMVPGRLLFAERRWLRRVAPGVTYVLDVHWRVVNAHEFAAALPFDELAATAVAVPGLPSARAPNDGYSLLVAAVHHVVQHGAGFDPLWLYDIALLASRLGESGLAETAALARRHGLEAAYLHALHEAARWYGTSAAAVPGPAAAEAQRALDVYTRPDARLIDLVWRDVAALPTWRARLRLLGEHLFPPASYMLRRYGVSRRLWLPWLYVRRAITGWPGWLGPLANQRAAQIRRTAAGEPLDESAWTPDRYTEAEMGRSVSLDDVVRIPEEVLYRELDGELVLLNLRTGVFFGLDSVGTRIWHLLATHGSLGRVHRALVAEYEAPPRQLERDLIALVEKLRRKGLVVCTTPSSRGVASPRRQGRRPRR